MPSAVQPIEFVPVNATSADIDWCPLKTVDMSTFMDGLEAQKKLAETLRDAMHTQGFFYLTNFGFTKEEIKRQVDIGWTVLQETPLETKKQLRSQMQEAGSYRGFKLRNYYIGAGGVTDRIEQWNWYRDMKSQEFPDSILPWKDEVAAFTEKLHKEVLKNIWQLFALALELPINTFVDKHKFDVNDESWMRVMAYYDEFTPEEEAKVKSVWLGGHADFGSLTLLFSQPMASLQVRNDEGKWQYVKHVPGAMVVNAGQFMDWYTGGYFKAAVHRVFAPPADQRGHTRCGLFDFIVPNDEEHVSTLMESPVLQRAGIKAREASQCTTSKIYSQARISKVGKTEVFRSPAAEGGIAYETIAGINTPWYG